jgi:single-strand DNA-binding protein
MSQGGYVTLVGFVAREPSLRKTKDDKQVADVRVGATTRYYDKTRAAWTDGDTSYYTVTCWRRLAGHVRASLHKGDPVMVKGRFRTHTYEDKQGRIRTEVEITADTIGHDLSRGVANYIRPAERQRAADEDDDAAERDYPSDGEGGDGDGGDGDGDGAVLAGTGIPPFGAPDGSPGVSELESDAEVGEEEAVEQLSRELDKALAEDGELGPDNASHRIPSLP